MAKVLQDTGSDQYWLTIIDHLRKEKRWGEIACLQSKLPVTLDANSLELAGEIAFSLSRDGRRDEAVALLDRCWRVERNAARAAGIAYQYYEKLFTRKNSRKGSGNSNGKKKKSKGGKQGKYNGGDSTLLSGDQKSDLCEFLKWSKEAASLDENPIKVLYRVGNIEWYFGTPPRSLYAFKRVIELYEALDEETKKKRHDWAKPYCRSLYGAARAAYKLGKKNWAKHYIFTCIRSDQRDYHEARDKFYLAGQVCAACGQLDDADRAYRKSLDAETVGYRDNTYIYAALARLALERTCYEDAKSWVEDHIRPERRKPYVWRILGDAYGRLNKPKQAENAYRNALHKDRNGRHKTHIALGRLFVSQEKWQRAEEEYSKARDFKEKKYASADKVALRGLLNVAKNTGNEQLLKDTQHALSVATEEYQRPASHAHTGGTPTHESGIEQRHHG